MMKRLVTNTHALFFGIGNSEMVKQDKGNAYNTPLHKYEQIYLERRQNATLLLYVSVHVCKLSSITKNK